tara:strand:- start:213 stop:989 length:777 start_codon:yes stop_codon:yes gene_type:complete
MNIHLLSFGNTAYYGSALTRLLVQANQWRNNNKQVFSSITLENELTLQRKYADFWNLHGSFLLKRSRGFGYWLWKPFLIWQTLCQIPEDDILIYLDAGCQINTSAYSRFQDYITLAEHHNACVFQQANPSLLDEEYCKADTILAVLGQHGIDTIENKVQLVASIQIMKSNTTTRSFTKSWFDWSCEDNYHYIDDSPSKHQNSAIFKDHRHDQSIFSLLYKKEKVGTIIADETYWAPEWHLKGALYPFWATRNPSSTIL